VTSKVELRLWRFRFRVSRLHPSTSPRLTKTRALANLGSWQTEDPRQRRAHDFDLQLERFAGQPIRCGFHQGRFREGGLNVTGYVNTLECRVALPYVGYKPDGDLRYIDMKKPRAVDLMRLIH